MKKIPNMQKGLVTFLLLLILICILLLVWSCGSEDPQQRETDRVKEVLASGTWKVQSVQVDGADQTSVYEELTLHFTAVGFTANHGEPLWPANGTWAFSDNTGKLIKRNDDLVIEIADAKMDKLIFKFTWSEETLGSGRTQSVSGDHTFTFVK